MLSASVLKARSVISSWCMKKLIILTNHHSKVKRSYACACACARARARACACACASAHACACACAHACACACACVCARLRVRAYASAYECVRAKYVYFIGMLVCACLFAYIWKIIKRD